MPRRAAVAVENNFTRGLITDATGLNFPENAAIDADNVIFDSGGTVSLRPGCDFENNYVLKEIDRTELAQSIYLWKNVTGDGNVNIVVHQVGSTLYFYDTASDLSLSAGAIADTVDLTDFLPAGGSDPAVNECSFASGLGYLYVVHPNLNPFYITYDIDNDLFLEVEIPIIIRDTIGLVENVVVDARPATLTEVHHYNLLNQGWPSDKITAWDTARTDFPSNADVWWIFKDSTDVFDVAQVANHSRQSTPAPRGFFRVSPWDTARETTASDQAGVAGLNTDVTDEDSNLQRPSVVAFHAGRLFYAGVNARGYNSKIYFTQLIENTSHFGACHSANDPTSEYLFDFLPTDGGVISIPDAGTIFAMKPLGNNLIIFGANGVWAIGGNQGIGFTATDFTIAKIDETRSISGTSFVELTNAIAWWNTNGIHLLAPGQQGQLTVQDLVKNKIEDFFADIPAVSKRFARGVFNQRTGIVQWLYHPDDLGTVTDKYTFSHILNLDIASGAFYPWSLADTDAEIHGAIVLEGTVSLTVSEDVVDDLGALVVDDLGATVFSFGFSQTTANTVTKFITSVPSGATYDFTFAEFFNEDFKEFEQYDSVGVAFEGYFVTGYKVRSEGQRRFQSNYIFIFTDNSDVRSSYIFQARWDYATSGDTGDWTGTQTIEHDETERAVTRRRLKVRGEGEVVQFKFSSVTGEPFNIIGWSTYETANARI